MAAEPETSSVDGAKARNRPRRPLAFVILGAALLGIPALASTLIPSPFVPGNRWTYQIRVAGLRVGEVERTLPEAGHMAVRLSTRAAERNGTYHYELAVHGSVLGARSVRFAPSEGGSPFEFTNCVPPIPLFAVPGSAPFDIEYPISCTRAGTTLSGTARARTVEHDVTVEGIPGCHGIESSSGIAPDLLKSGRTWVHPRYGVVASEVPVNALLTSRWSLVNTSFTPMP